MARWRDVMAARRDDSSSSVGGGTDTAEEEEEEVTAVLEESSLGSAAVRSAANCCCWWWRPCIMTPTHLSLSHSLLLIWIKELHYYWFSLPSAAVPEQWVIRRLLFWFSVYLFPNCSGVCSYYSVKNTVLVILALLTSVQTPGYRLTAPYKTLFPGGKPCKYE